MNTLYYGDNLKILSDRNYFPDECVDLIYLDPPFNSNRNYNVLFKDESGAEAEAQITAFEDTWHWNQAAENAYHDLVVRADDVSKMLEAFRTFIGENQMMAYLVMMAARLVELHRVLKDTGSLYLHCDPTASHYLKILLDTIVGAGNFRNEIVWRRKGGSALKGMRIFSTATDTIFFYSKSNDYTFNTVYMPLDEEYISDHFTKIDEKGRRFQATVMRSPNPRPNLMYDYKGYKTPPNGWAVSRARMEELDKQGSLYFPEDKSKQIYRKIYLDEYPGQPANNLWTDIKTLKGKTAELLGYPTQKPVALLERIIQASSNEGDVVLDPFCGCGTTIAAAQKLNRRWIGIDITHLSIALQKYRLKDSFGIVPIGKRSEPPAAAGGSNAADSNDKAQPNNTAKNPPVGAGGSDRTIAAYRIVGEPEDLASAIELARKDNERYQFQWWALSLIKARPLGAAAGGKQGKKGSDKGIDGVIPFFDDRSGKSKRVLVQVKSGKVKSGDIRDLRGTLQRENASIGVFITLENPSKDMITEAVSAGFYRSEFWHRDYPKIQILTIEELLNGKEVRMPTDSTAFKQAERVTSDPKQIEMF